MPKMSIPEITISADDAEILRSIASKSKVTQSREYVCTYLGRFLICVEKHNGKFFYYAADYLRGKFSLVLESSFERSAESLYNECRDKLRESVRYTGIFNRIPNPKKKSVMV